MNCVTLGYSGGIFTATVSIAPNWSVVNVALNGGMATNVKMNGVYPQIGPGNFQYTFPYDPPFPSPMTATVFTATASFQQMQLQSLQGTYTA